MTFRFRSAGTCLCFFTAIAFTFIGADPARGPAPTKPTAPVRYSEVQALFDRTCVACHNDKMPQSQLSLSGHAQLLKGGKQGLIVVPGKSAGSLLIDYLEGKRQPRMPLNSPPVPAATIARLKLWIDQGAKPESGPASGTAPPAAAPMPPPFARAEIRIPVSLEIPAPEDLTFHRDIFPILRAQCLDCHGPENPRSGLRLNSLDSMRMGGDSGPPIKPGKSAQSLLVKRLEGTTGRKMPLGGSLPNDQIEKIKRWIDQGARPGLAEAERAPEMVLRSLPLPLVSALAFSPDGRNLAIGTFRRLLIVDLPSGKVLQDLREASGTIHDLRYAPGGKMLAAAGGVDGQQGEVIMWDTATWKIAQTLKEHTDTVFALAFSGDGKKMVTGSNDKTVRLWDLSTGKVQEVLKDSADAVYAVGISPDGVMIAGGGADKTVKVWKAGAGLQRTLTQTQDTVTSVYFSTDGKQIFAAGFDGAVRKWQTDDGKNIANIGHGERVLGLAMDSQGKMLASCGSDATVKVWNEGNANVRTLSGSTDWVFSVALSPDGKYLASGSNDGVVRVYAFADGRFLASLLFFENSPGSETAAQTPWLFVTPEGYYEGTEAIRRDLKWRIRGELVSGEVFTAALYRPEMVSNALALQPVTPAKLNLAPPVAPAQPDPKKTPVDKKPDDATAKKSNSVRKK